MKKYVLVASLLVATPAMAQGLPANVNICSQWGLTTAESASCLQDWSQAHTDADRLAVQTRYRGRIGGTVGAATGVTMGGTGASSMPPVVTGPAASFGNTGNPTVPGAPNFGVSPGTTGAAGSPTTTGVTSGTATGNIGGASIGSPSPG